jgi:hypothetical protein
VIVVPCGAMVPCCGIDCVGAQPVAFLGGAGGAVCAWPRRPDGDHQTPPHHDWN